MGDILLKFDLSSEMASTNNMVQQTVQELDKARKLGTLIKGKLHP